MRKPFDGNYPITQTFGNKLIINGVNIYAQWGYLGHNGIDYGCPNGTPILAPHNGKIIEAAFDANGYGNYVKIENDIEGSVLAHFQSLSVKVGDQVSEGQQVGLSNNTGASTGAHLHWGYYRHPRNKQNGYGGFIDQTSYLVSISIPTMDTITQFLISVGYTYPEAHLEVVKVLYDSDKKLKSGNYISKEDCEKEKDGFKQQCTKEKQQLQDAFTLEKQDWEKKKIEDIKISLENAKKEWKIEELQGQAKELEDIKNSQAYKIASIVETILKFIKFKKTEEVK